MLRRIHTVANKFVFGQIKEVCHAKESLYYNLFMGFSKRAMVKNIVVEDIHTKECLTINVLDNNIWSSELLKKMNTQSNFIVFYNQSQHVDQCKPQHYFISIAEVIDESI